MLSCKTYEVKINIGLQEGYDGETLSYEKAESIILDYVNEFPIGLTITKTRFMYPGGEKNGLIIGLINYPRFPMNNTGAQSPRFIYGV